MSSLQFVDYSQNNRPMLMGTSSNFSSLINHTQYTKEELLDIYLKDLDSFIMKEDNEDVEALTNKSADLIKEIVKVKKMISKMKNKYNMLSSSLLSIKDNIKKYQDLKDACIHFGQLYVCTFNKEVDKSYFEEIHNLEMEEKNKMWEMETNIQTLIQQINALKQIIKDDEAPCTTEVLCGICDENKVDCCFTPCGHSFCIECSDRAKDICHMCRRKIDGKVKLYF